MAPTPTPLVAEVATETGDMGAAMSGTLEEEPVASAEPMVEEVPGLSYNIGGGVTNGKFEEDPTDFLVGKTSSFEIPGGVIGGPDLWIGTQDRHIRTQGSTSPTATVCPARRGVMISRLGTQETTTALFTMLRLIPNSSITSHTVPLRSRSSAKFQLSPQNSQDGCHG